MSNHNLQICENEKFVSLPYDKINFLISEKFIEGTTAWHDFESNINELNWDNLDKIPFLNKEVPYLSFDLIAELFNLNSKKDDEKHRYGKNRFSTVVTAIILENCEKSLITSVDCSVVNSEDFEIKNVGEIPEKIQKKLGIESFCFIDEKLGIIINPFHFLTVVKENLLLAEMKEENKLLESNVW